MGCPANINLIKVNNGNTRKRREICSKLSIKTSERRQRRRSAVFSVTCEHIAHLFLVFLLLTLNKKILARCSFSDPKSALGQPSIS